MYRSLPKNSTLATCGALATALLTSGLLACASQPQPQPIAVSKIAPGPNQRVVDQAVILLDTSGSIDELAQFPQARALLRSFVGGMPDGSYEVDVIAFGGADREVFAGTFDRNSLGEYSKHIQYLADGTPLHSVFVESKIALTGKSSEAAVILISDGLPSDVIGRDVSSDLALDAARDLAASYQGELCIHTVQVGNEPAGAAFLKQLSQTTPCGTSRTAASLNTAVAVQGLGRDALLADMPQVAAAPPSNDADRDGVLDAVDACPRTPAGARVDNRGCWVPELYFKLDTAEFGAGSETTLEDQILPVLRANPDVRVRIDGYTDSSGTEVYNQALSERRAERVRRELVSQGIAADRLETQGFGESNPAAPNDSVDGRRINRRTEISALK